MKFAMIHRPNSSKQRNENTFVIVFILVLFYGIYYFYNKSISYTIDRNTLFEVPLTIAHKPQLNVGGKNKSLTIRINEYPDFNFDISGITLNASNNIEFAAKTEAGDTLFLMLDKGEYRQKLLKTEPLTFWNKRYRFMNISIFGIRTYKGVWLTTNSYVMGVRKDYKWGVWGIIFLLIYLLYTLVKELRTLKKDPSV
jgi:hypothetical protein